MNAEATVTRSIEIRGNNNVTTTNAHNYFNIFLMNFYVRNGAFFLFTKHFIRYIR